MSNRFEKLIEYVINDEDDKARELFHDIVVEKSRQIYEEMMDQEEMSEAKEEDEDDKEVTEAQEEDDEEVTEGMDGDDAMGRMDQYDEGMGGDAADKLIDDVEMEEEGMSMEAMGDDDEMGGEEGLEDRVIKLEDEVDRLVAEFEDLMDGDFGDEDMDVHGGDELEMDDTEEFGNDEGEEEFGGSMDDMDDMDNMGDKGMMENVSLKAAPKPTNSEEGGINKKAVYAANSGAAGMQGKPVHTGTSMGGKNDTSAYSNSHKDLIGDFQNKAGNSMKDQKAAPRPVTSQATGVNTKSPVKGR